nr:anti-sigma factor domain-containing protein [Neobacillus sp. Marseille-Q6967]
MKKGIIMEVNDSYLTLLTPDGEFLKAQKQDIPYSVGDEIHFFSLTAHNSSNRSFHFRKMFNIKTVWLSIASLLLCFGSFIPIYQSHKTYAYMSIDADTSIELGLNKQMQVVELTGFNNQTEKVISELDDWEKKDVTKLAPVLLEQLKDKGLINESELVILSTVKTKELDDIAKAKLEKSINEIKQTVDHPKLEVNTYVTTKEEIMKAHDSGVSVGKYYEELNNSADKKDKKHKENSNKAQSIINETEKPVISSPAPTSELNPGQLKKQPEVNNVPSEKPVGNVNNNSQKDTPKNEINPGQQRKAALEKVKQSTVQQPKQTNENKNNKLNKHQNK